MKKTANLIALLIILVLSSTPVFAQKGSIKGKVIDANTNQPLPFTNIVIRGTQTGATSNEDGTFIINDVTPGFMKLNATQLGYKPFTSEDFQVTSSRTPFVEIAMIPTSVELEKVEIKASPFEKKAGAPTSMRRMEISEIENNPGGNRDISKVIQSLPGVASSVAFRNDLIVRGGGPSENKFYLDGIEIPNLNHFATQGASGGPVGIINTDFIREVEFFSGAYPASRGNTLSSLLEMRQVDGNPDRLVFKGTVGASDLALAVDGPLGKRSSFVFSVRRSYLQFLFSALKLPFLPTYNDYQFKYKIRFDAKNELSIISIGSLDQSKLNTDIKDPDEEQRYILGYLPEYSQWSYTIGANYKHFRKNGFDTWVLSRSMLRNKSDKYFNNDESLETNKLQDYTSDEISNKFRYERSLIAAGWNINLSAGGEYNTYYNKSFQKVLIKDQVTDLNYLTNLSMFKYGLSAQAGKSFFAERLNIDFGFRVDGSDYSSEMSNPIEQFSPRVALSWALNEKWSLNGNIGRFYQLPSYTTLGFRDNSGVLVNKENGVKYIGMNQLVAGLEYRPNDNSRITLEGFYKHYNNYPFSIQDSVSLASKSVDFGVYGDEAVTSTSKGRAYGFELLIRSKSFYGFNIIMAYTFVRSEFTDINEKYIASAWDNRHLITSTIMKNLPRNWEIGIKWRFVGGVPYTPYDYNLSSKIDVWDSRGRGVLDYSQFNTQRLGNYHQLDLRVDKQYYFKKLSMRFYLDIQNLYNFKGEQPSYLTNLTAEGTPNIDPTDPTRYILRTIKNDVGQVLPTIGVIVQF